MRNFASLTKFDSQSFSIKENVLYIYHSKHIREIPNPQHSSIGLDSLYPAYSSVQFTHSVMSDSLRPHGLQHARPPSPSTAPRVYSNSCPSSRWCHPSGDLILCHPLLLLPSIFSSTRVFSNEPGLHIRWPKYWSFSISPQWFSRLISFRIHWLESNSLVGSCSPRNSQESSPMPQFKSIYSSVLSFLVEPIFFILNFS